MQTAIPIVAGGFSLLIAGCPFAMPNDYFIAAADAGSSDLGGGPLNPPATDPLDAADEGCDIDCSGEGCNKMKAGRGCEDDAGCNGKNCQGRMGAGE
jgi:hypothetical protein